MSAYGGKLKTDRLITSVFCLRFENSSEFQIMFNPAVYTSFDTLLLIFFDHY